MNRVPTLAEMPFAVAFDVTKYLYKYRFNSPCVTRWLSTTTLWRSKTYYFALQKRRFCKVKAAVLRCKTYAFGKPKKNTRFSVKIFHSRGKAKWSAQIVASVLQTRQRKDSQERDSSRSYTENTTLFGGWRFTTSTVRNVINRTATLLPCTTRNRKIS